MNNILIVIITAIFSCTSVPSAITEPITITDSSECSNLYPFQGYYIDLENNNAVLIDGLPATDFRKCSKYAHRFVNPVSDSVCTGNRSFVIEKNKEKKIYQLNIFEGAKKINTLMLPVENPLPDVHEYYFNLLPYKNDVIMFMEDMYKTHYIVCKYDINGRELIRKEIEHTFVTHPEPKTDYHHRYLYFGGLTSSQMIFTSSIGFAEKHKTVVLSMDDFSVQEFDRASVGIIPDSEEKYLAGFISQKEGNYTVTMLNGKEFHFDLPNGNNACDMILKGDLLYIANYHPIATGSSLYCYDLKAGKMKWTADVKQINASHSEYFNKVTLSMYKNKIIMEGDEESGDYVQLFDAETGKRLAAFGDFIELKK